MSDETTLPVATEKKEGCDCLRSLRSRLEEKIKKDEGEKQKGFEYLEGDFEQYSFFPTVKLYTVFKYKSSFQKVNGTRSQPKSKDISIMYTFCPFCGERYDRSDLVTALRQAETTES